MIAVPRSERPRASIVICAARNAGNLRECLASLERHGCDGMPCETIVVLNGADDEVAAVAHDEQRGATVIEAPINVGFAAGGNLGRSVARGEYVVLLHDDAFVCAGWLAALVETADAHPAAGAVGGLVLWPNGRVQSAGVIKWRGGEWTLIGEGDDPRHVGAALRAVDQAPGSSLLVRAATFDAVGGLDDELYPAGWVDGTLSYLIRRLGQVVLVDPRSRSVHERGGTLDRMSGYRHFVYERNRERFLERFAPELARLPPRPSDPDELARGLDEARERLAADWRRRAAEWSGSPPAAPRAAGPFPADAPRAERIEAALKYIERERALRAEWDQRMLDHVARVEADNAALRASRDEAVEYARSLEAERERRQAP